jgi:hypothetical protein
MLPKFRYTRPLMLTSALVAACLLSACGPQKRLVDPYGGQLSREQAAAQGQGGLNDVRPVRPNPQAPSPPVQEQRQNLLLPTMTMVNDRIYAYERKLEQWEEVGQRLDGMALEQADRDRLASCQQQVRAMLVEYNALHQRLLQRDDVDAAMLLASDSLLQLSSRDIALLEGECAELIRDPAAAMGKTTPSGSSLHLSEAALQEAGRQRRYSDVIALYQQLPLERGQKASFQSRYQYGQALLRTGKAAEARSAFVDLLADIRQQDQTQWEFRLLQLIGDLEFGLGLYDAAKEEYRALGESYAALGESNDWAKQQLAALTSGGTQQEEIEAYSTLLFGFLTYNPDRDGYGVVEKGEAFTAKYPYSPVASNADALIKRARTEAEAWLDGVLKEVDALTEQQRYQEAMLLMERVPVGILPADKQDLLRRRTGEVSTAESIAIETKRMVKEQTLQEDWNKAMVHLEGREYDLAIEVFESMIGTSYEERAKKQIAEAVELAANEQRRKAAELFRRADRSPDAETKLKLLFASRQLLQDILVKYPQSELIDRINGHLAKIEEEINALDPNRLQQPTTLEGQPVESTEEGPGVQQESDGTSF